MVFTCSIEINKPKDEVMRFFFDEAFLPSWQDGFIKKTWLKGDYLQKDSVAEISYKMGRSQMILTETVIAPELPHSYKGLYEHKHMSNTLMSSFIDMENGQTRIVQEVDYLKFNGFVPRMMATLFPGMFKKQAQKWLNQFKKSIENSTQ